MSNITDRRAVADKLREARALIERGWTQGANARNREGLDLDDADPAADNEPVCWCAGGAIWQVATYGDWHNLRQIFREVIGGNEIPDWNDAPKRTQAEVLAAFDKAITLADSSQ